MCHQMPIWCGIRCKIVLENYGCGCVRAVPDAMLKFDRPPRYISHLHWNSGECRGTFAETLVNVKRGGVYMGKMGSICHFPRALPASIWGHCSQVLVFTSIWGTQKGVWQWHFSCCLSQHLGILGPPNTAKQGETQNDKSTLFCPPTGGGSGETCIGFNSLRHTSPYFAWRHENASGPPWNLRD